MTIIAFDGFEYCRVSIHTPTQGVTVFGRWLSERLGVSIHTPTQGVTLRGMALQTILNRFNPHTHAGCDDDVLKTAIVTKVSIHTPTQGVTK